MAAFPLGDNITMIRHKIDLVAADRSDLTALQSISQLVPVAEGHDDCHKVLHPARFFRGSLSHPKVGSSSSSIFWFPPTPLPLQEFWSCVPIRHDPALSNIQLSHLALENAMSPATIKKLHNRSAVITTKQLLAANAAVESRAPVSKRRRVGDGSNDSLEVGWVNDYNWYEAENVAQIQVRHFLLKSIPPTIPLLLQEAAVAYVAVMQCLHPVDYGPVALLQTLVKFQHFFAMDLSGPEQRKLLTKYMDTVFQVR